VTKLTNTNEEEAGEKTGHRALKLFVYPFEVIVSPFKAFKKIAQNLTVKGFALVVILIIAASIGEQFVYASKIFISILGWQPISPKLHIYPDAYVYVTTFGNYTFNSSQPLSINYTLIDKTPLTEYSVFLVNTTETLTSANPLVSTNTNDTFYQATVDLNQSASKVGNFTLTAIFYPDSRPKFSVLLSKTDEWNLGNLGNFTINWFIRSPYTFLANHTTAIDVASKATLSLLETNAKRAELGNTESVNNWRFSILNDWSDYGNATIHGGNHTLLTYSGTWLDVVFDVNDPEIDPTTVGVTYSSLVSIGFFGDYLLFGAFQTGLTIFLSWLIYAGALYLIVKMFSEERKEEKSKNESEEESEKRSITGITWLPFFLLVGYAFSVAIIRSAVSAVLFSTLPEINFQLATQAEVTFGDKVNAIWGPSLMFQVGAYFDLLVDIWFAMLGAIAVHASREISWAKAVMVSVIAYFIYFTLRLFMGFW